jgi:two-component system chemotaxis response regulator CheY
VMRILIVDDSAMMRKMIRRVLALVDVPIDEIFEAANGAEALAILQEHEIDVLLTDINMPVMTGTELLREIAKSKRWINLRRVIISTDGSASRRDEAAGLDVRCYLEKPFSPEVIRDVLLEVA